MHFKLRITAATVAAAFAAFATLTACASNSQYASSSAAGTVDLAAYPNPDLSASELQLLRGMSDQEILGHIILVDSMEVATADSTIRIAMSDPILSYARLMHAVHTKDLADVRSLGRERGITPVQTFGGLRASHVAADLDSIPKASDLTLDRHYIMSQVELHQHVLRELEVLQQTTRDPALRSHIDMMIPVVRDHLARAHAIAVEKGFEKKRS